jgi:hypothetical protein
MTNIKQLRSILGHEIPDKRYLGLADEDPDESWMGIGTPATYWEAPNISHENSMS